MKSTVLLLLFVALTAGKPVFFSVLCFQFFFEKFFFVRVIPNYVFKNVINYHCSVQHFDFEIILSAHLPPYYQRAQECRFSNVYFSFCFLALDKVIDKFIRT